jgi:hypothetical protein
MEVLSTHLLSRIVSEGSQARINALLAAETIHAAPRKKPIICVYWLHCLRQNGIQSTPSVNQ